jgi:hypothetical protein
MGKRNKRIRPTKKMPAKTTVRYFASLKQWAKTSKPTEWIVAIGTLFGTVATLIGGIALWRSGLIDAKRTEITAQNAKLEASQIELRTQNRNLESDERNLQERIGRADSDIFQKQKVLDKTLADLESSKARLSQYMTNEYHLRSIGDLTDSVVARPIGSLICKPSIDPKTDTVEIRLGIADVPASPKNIASPAKVQPLDTPDTKRVFSVLSRLKGVSLVCIDSVKVDEDDLVVISKLPTLRYCYLRNCGITDSSIDNLVLQKNVNYLSVSHNPITRLPRIQESWAIQGLDISTTEIKDGELVGFLGGAINLATFNANDTPITDTALKAIPVGQVRLATIQTVGTRVTKNGVMDLIGRLKPKWMVANWMTEQEQKQADAFIKNEKIQTGLIVVEKDSPRTASLGYTKHGHDLASSREVRSLPGELIMLSYTSADNGKRITFETSSLNSTLVLKEKDD